MPTQLSPTEILDWVATGGLDCQAGSPDEHAQALAERQLLVGNALLERTATLITDLETHRQNLVNILHPEDYIAPFCIPTYRSTWAANPKLYSYDLSPEGQTYYLQELIETTAPKRQSKTHAGSVALALVGGSTHRQDALPQGLFKRVGDGLHSGIEFGGSSRQGLERVVRDTRGFEKRRGDCLLTFIDNWLKQSVAMIELKQNKKPR